MKGKITVKLIFAAIQSFVAFSAIVLAGLLRFNLLNSQSALNVGDASLNFYVIMLIIFGFIFLIGGFFLIYEWWEER